MEIPKADIVTKRGFYRPTNKEITKEEEDKIRRKKTIYKRNYSLEKAKWSILNFRLNKLLFHTAGTKP